MRTLNFKFLFPNYGGTTQLFLDYIYNFKNVARYYAHDFNDFNIGLIQNVLAGYKNRNKVAEILRRQNLSLGNRYAGENIDLFEKENTLAVVTGQQVGLFTGPVYTIYKIISAIKLSSALAEKFPEYNFVPVFYLEGEDHDFFEANNAKIFNSNNELVKIEFIPEHIPKENYGPVGALKFDKKIKDVLNKIESELQDSEFKSEIMNLLRYAYDEGVNFTEAFVRFCSELFKDFGLIFLDPSDPELKQLLLPIFRKEIEEHPKLAGLIIDVSAELERKYHAQVKPRPLNLFLIYKDGRFPIEPDEQEGMFKLKGIRFKFSKGELINILETNPQLLSPNVVLRPICQDTLLPTVAYVAGPSEIAYFAQFKPAYDYFNIQMPVIFPRISATLIEPKVKKILDKYQIDIREVYTDFQSLAKKIILSNSEVDIQGFFDSVKSQFELLLEGIKSFVSGIDPSLSDAVTNSSGKILYHINSIYEKALSASQRKNEIANQQIQKLKLNLLPEDELQERVLNITYFLNKYSFGLISKLFDELEIFEFNHQFVYL
ncbi:bacillithiol biosynthesis cysteine-adding enzyme BshC [Candidatus Thermokryptus mobilis]|uniref:Putative cysteine ligase BshC n=1 Tax=Candidatus Thermokryptus mobilis TaxID=1643428 RepID=A0A0S4MZU7_9BACT|nr:bacillithiol biosynthesis cysteine-adding enzyme BshC [Candidatus Thermokryptus mobilis]CUU04416.1 bacillithiol biosynthesis cysteine-adding enzyme BshC [Candidatus Thermokryptus mobilis]